MMMSVSSTRAATLAAIYVGLAAVYILFSDAALRALVPSVEDYAVWSTIKGWAFVAVTGLFLYFGTRALLRRGWAEGDQARRLLACSGDGIYGVDLAGTCTFANQALADMLGYTAPDSLMGQPMHELIHPRAPDGPAFPMTACPVHGRIADGESFRKLREVMVRRDGTQIPVEVSGEPLTDDTGRLVGAVITLRDVAALEQAQAAVQESEQRFRQLFQNAPVPYQSLDADGRLIAVNDAWLDTLGYRREHVIGQWFGDFLAPVDRDRFPVHFEAFKAQNVARGVEFDMVTADGDARRVSFEGRVGRTQGGEFVQTHCVLTDLTERRAFFAALENSVEGTAKADAELVRFSQVVAHDLQEPVREVVSFLDLLQRKAGSTLSPDTKDYIGFAQAAGQRMKQHLLALQSFVQVVTQRQAFVPVSLGPVMRDALACLEADVVPLRDHVTVGDLPTVTGDPGLLRVLFRGLLDNAVRYTRAGVPPEVKVDATVVDAAAIVRVMDNGRGIEATMRARVFEAFVRMPAPGEPISAGMGLTVARKICGIHSGDIWIEDRADDIPGTVVCVRLACAGK
jgi:PAS domain S-box-containing protein